MIGGWISSCFAHVVHKVLLHLPKHNRTTINDANDFIKAEKIVTTPGKVYLDQFEGRLLSVMYLSTSVSDIREE